MRSTMWIHTAISSLQYTMARAILAFQDEAKKAIAGGADLESVVNVQARTDIMRGRFEEGYEERIEKLVKEMASRYRYYGGELRRDMNEWKRVPNHY